MISSGQRARLAEIEELDNALKLSIKPLSVIQ